MTSKKKAAPKKRSSTKSKAKPRSQAGRLRKFLRAFVASSAAAFGVASCALNPQWQDSVSLDGLFSQVGWPRAEQNAPPVVPSQGYAQTRFTQCPQFFPSGGMPVVPASQAMRELCFSAFAILHNGQTKTPVFVAQRLNRRMLAQTGDVQRTDKFYAEARLPQAERAVLDDYRNSGYSRGHMAPAGDMHTPEAMAQSFSLANMVPQNQTHNGGAWSRIEQDTRSYVQRASGDVFVFTGPFYGTRPKTIGAGQVAVPSHVYKLVYDPATGRSWAHWHANSPDTVAGPPISYEEFVRRTGMHLLPAQQR